MLEAADPGDEAIRLDKPLWSAAGEAQEKRMVTNPYGEVLEVALGDRMDQFRGRLSPPRRFGRQASSDDDGAGRRDHA